MRRQQYNHKQLRRKKKHKKRDNKYQIPHLYPCANPKATRRYLRDHKCKVCGRYFYKCECDDKNKNKL